MCDNDGNVNSTMYMGRYGLFPMTNMTLLVKSGERLFGGKKIAHWFSFFIYIHTLTNSIVISGLIQDLKMYNLIPSLDARISC